MKIEKVLAFADTFFCLRPSSILSSGLQILTSKTVNFFNKNRNFLSVEATPFWYIYTNTKESG
ncbi:hypothetical protein BKI52_08370 [marine bacterium AO1-C]|nr:hypothetical protein BKI52_08370 [marine bacterium AO1-C]